MSHKSRVFTDQSGLAPISIKMEDVSPPPPAMSLPQHRQYATASDLSDAYLQNPVAGYSYLGGAGSKQPMDDAVKKEIRLTKNREAAKECRRKKKEYFSKLQCCVAMLENQNKSLKDELKAIKQFYNLQ